MGCKWCCVIGKCNCRLLDALQWWVQGDHGLRVVVPYYWGMQVQNARHLIMVVSSFKVVMGCKWLRCIIEECNCRFLGALQWWVQGGHGLRGVVPC